MDLWRGKRNLFFERIMLWFTFLLRFFFIFFSLNLIWFLFFFLILVKVFFNNILYFFFHLHYWFLKMNFFFYFCERFRFVDYFLYFFWFLWFLVGDSYCWCIGVRYIFRWFETMNNSLHNLKKKDDEEGNNTNDIKHCNFFIIL